jgi:hypothetical protein
MTVFAITSVSLKMIYPMFRHVPDAMIEYAIEAANLKVDSSLGDYYLYAFNLVTAHYLTIMLREAQTGGTGLTIESMNVGGEISYTYADPASHAGSGKDYREFDTTTYGQRYLDLIHDTVPAIGIC